MAKVIENGRFTSVAVEHVGSRFNIWRFDRAQREYEVFCNQRGGLSITFSGDDAEKLALDLETLQSGQLTKESLEERLEEKIVAFLNNIHQ
jgi:hypothetical protein